MSDQDASPAAVADPPAMVRRRSPALAFLIGVAVIGALAVLAYLFWPDRAETPATPEEAAITDEALGLPAPDAASVRAQVDQALRTAPRDPAGRAESAAAAAQAQTAPEREDVQPQDTSPLATPSDRVPPAGPQDAAPVAPPENR